jgi:hypothetical protein
MFLVIAELAITYAPLEDLTCEEAFLFSLHRSGRSLRWRASLRPVL